MKAFFFFFNQPQHNCKTLLTADTLSIHFCTTFSQWGSVTAGICLSVHPSVCDLVLLLPIYSIFTILCLMYHFLTTVIFKLCKLHYSKTTQISLSKCLLGRGLRSLSAFLVVLFLGRTNIFSDNPQSQWAKSGQEWTQIYKTMALGLKPSGSFVFVILKCSLEQSKRLLKGLQRVSSFCFLCSLSHKASLKW